MITKKPNQTDGLKEQPYIKKASYHKLINYWWSKTFYDNDYLRLLAKGCVLEPREGYGLIYYYLINNKVCYVGQTKERSLRWRMTKHQTKHKIGYRYGMKRRMLNANRFKRLSIKTKEVPVDQLDDFEIAEIRKHASRKLWNIEHNKHSRFNKQRPARKSKIGHKPKKGFRYKKSPKSTVGVLEKAGRYLYKKFNQKR